MSGERLASVHVLHPSPQVDVGPTDVQRAVLVAIRQSMVERGHPPTMREIAVASGLQTPPQVQACLDELTALGYLRRAEGRERAVEVDVPAPTGAPGGAVILPFRARANRR